MKRRVRHHTDDAGLESIMAEGAIHVSRGWADIPSGVHVEVEPFGTTRPSKEGLPGPKNEMGCTAQGAYVEFDAPPEMVPYYCGPRNTAIIPTERPFAVASLNPKYVKVRHHWWQLWRTKAE